MSLSFLFFNFFSFYIFFLILFEKTWLGFMNSFFIEKLKLNYFYLIFKQVKFLFYLIYIDIIKQFIMGNFANFLSINIHDNYDLIVNQF